MRWQLALAQHPMYMLIREDTQCAERTPPWGAPTIEAYIERVRQNLAALDRYPRLKLGYEWSAVELELLAKDSPQVFDLLRTRAEEGRVCFYNGTYAQPHLQILSAESNVRQFQFGQQAYRELGLKPVQVYAHQEASVHDQVPQLLRAFDIPFAVVPGFLTTLAWIDPGEILLHGVRGPRFLQGHELISWQGLDGSETALFFHQPIPREMTFPETLAREYVLGRLSAPTLMVDLPDMIAIDDDWMAERSALEFVTLDEALCDRRQKYPPRSRARLYTNWSYLEGIRAEELSRCTWQAEREVTTADALNSIVWALDAWQPGSSDEVWKTILTAQHHDVYCFSAPELRDQSIQALSAAARKAAAAGKLAVDTLLPRIQTAGQPGQPVVVFGVTPHAQDGLVEIRTDVPNPSVVDSEGRPVPCEAVQSPNEPARVKFLAHTNGLCYRTCWIQSGVSAAHQATSQPFAFENAFYRVQIEPDGTVSSLVLKPTGQELVDSEKGAGNRLSATDSSLFQFSGESPEARVKRYLADPPVRGPWLPREVSASAAVLQSSLGATFTVSGRMGERLQADLRIHCYHQLPRIDLQYDFHFDKASIGTFFDDDSKLLLRWPLAFPQRIDHDIPFGVIRESWERPFYPTTWVDTGNGEYGLAFFHQGVTNHWVSDGVLFNLLAWGEDTDEIHNGLGRYQWLKAFDQRLDGSHTIRMAVLPHQGDWMAADLPRQAREYAMPPAAFITDSHPGDLPSRLYVLEFDDPSSAATYVQVKGEQLVCRVYAAYGRNAQPRTRTNRLQPAGLRLLHGEPVAQLTPYQIGECRFNKSLERG